jgi:spermidine synthase
MTSNAVGKYDFVIGDAFNDLSVPYHLTTKEFARQLKRLMKPDGIMMVNIIDDFKKGTFLPSYVRTLEEVFGKGKVHLLLHTHNYGSIDSSTFIVAASPQSLDIDDFMKTITADGGAMATHVMPAADLQDYLRQRKNIVLTDDYVPVDNMLAPLFEERFTFRPKKSQD